MFDSIQGAVSSFTRRPLPFVSVALIHVLLQSLMLFALIGVFLVVFFTASLFRLSADLVLIAVAAILAILFLYFSSGLKGAALNAYSTVLGGGKVGFFEFYHYTLRNSPRFFGLFMVRSVVELMPSGLFLALYYIILKNWNLPYMDIFIGLVSSFFIFISHYLFYPSFISAATYGTGIMASLKNCFKFLRSAHIFALLLYAIYSIVWLTQFIPIINILTYFVTFPIAYCAMILYFQKVMRGGNAASAATIAKPPKYRKKARQQSEEDEESDDD